MSASDDELLKVLATEGEWSRLEYEELNRYGRTVYETFFRLTQMTFIINPALGVGFYYVFFEKREVLNKEGPFTAVIVAAAIAFLGVVYNFGAYGIYVRTHAYLEALLLRIREIDRQTGTTIHIAMKATAPYSYRRFWGAEAGRSRTPSDTLIKIFVLALAAGWAATLAYAVCRLT